MTRQLSAYGLLAAGFALLWWRSRQAKADDTLSPEALDQYQSIVAGLEPPEINERTLADGLPDAVNALNAAGLSGYITGPDGTLIVTGDKQLAAAITASKTPILPTAPKPVEDKGKPVQKYNNGQWYWYYPSEPSKIHWGQAPRS